MRPYAFFDYSIEWFYIQENGKTDQIPFKLFQGKARDAVVKEFKIPFRNLGENGKMLVRLTTKIDAKDLKCKIMLIKLFLS